ncbi:NAD(P)/FAD-dependent oxidoreductase [Flavihumibacter sp. ZG627]|uniref:phytoene desaturase family protein n=1 Tax=Flavihumibacter sp. ZG627 TaxID=1463156 RepID=UPI00057DA1AF|nr:phytoene desaturase family protein [Flavihumibacter sp. ZG627]KIC92318.1 phytoene dehydrogenase [Flavihumibacter sp. ZG627]
MGKKVIIIGSGFAGMSAAAFMARAGWDVTVIEKNDQPGGRARQWKQDGFTFDMGPSWYWMPDVFERFFQQFGKKVSDYYALERLDPSYRVYWSDEEERWRDGGMDIPAGLPALKELFESIEAGAGAKLEQFMEEAAFKYRVGMQKLVHKPGQSLTEFIDLDIVKGVFKLDVFTNMKAHVQKFFKDPKLKQLMEFPVLFLGAMPEDTPALYSLMNYADVVGGTWYPKGGMYSIVDAMYKLAKEQGAKFLFNETVTSIELHASTARSVSTDRGRYDADVVIGGADYHHIESVLLPETHRSYSEQYWDSRVMAPSCLLYYVGLNKKLEGIHHHSLFFDTSLHQHAREIYADPQWPSAPLFYVSATSVSDSTVAPEGCENLFLLVPVAAGLNGDTEEVREKYFDLIIGRLEKHLGQSVRDAIILKRSFAQSDFVRDYNSFKGNAYGLANTLKQTAILKPGCRSKKVNNLFFTGQLTVPGPGVPPSLISGELVAKEVIKNF